jgi:serine acetyltransferase
MSDLKRLHRVGGRKALTLFLFEQGFLFLLLYRTGSAIRGTIFFIIFRLLVEKPLEFFTKCYVPFTARIDEGLILWHFYGVVINGKTTIGKNCTIYPRVCIGNRWPGDGAPTIGSNVTIGTGACILGPINIPDNTTIKANSLVTPRNV